MNIKTLIISALLTLAVTIIGGAAVDYITTEKPWRKNKIEYTYKTTGSFQSGSERLEFTKLEIMNTGSQTQKSIEAEIEFENTTIQDLTISEKSRSLKPHINRAEDNKKILIQAATLFPKESITIELLTKTTKEETPQVIIRSTSTKGTPLTEGNDEPNALFGQAAKSIALIIFSVLTFAFIIGKKTVNLKGHTPNNIGFLLLHANEINSAGKYFEKDLEDATSGPYSLSNYALYKALTDGPESAQPYIAAAKFYSKTNHEKAVTTFNDSLIDAILNLRDDSEKKLSKAASLSKKEISKYCNYSAVVKNYIPNFNEVINRQTE